MSGPVMSAALQGALASLDREALAPQIRHIVHPRTGRVCAIEMVAGLWEGLDDLAHKCQTSTTDLCRFALLESPEADLADALWLFLRSVYVRLPNRDAKEGKIH